MKPTNIFTSTENFRKYNASSASNGYKKSGSKKLNHSLSMFASEKLKL